MFLQNFRLVGIIVGLLMTVGICSMASAQVAPEDGSWQHSWTGYLWVPGYNGDAVVRNVPVEVDMSISDTAEKISDLEAAFSGHYEGNKTPWSLIVDFTYWRIKENFWTRPDINEDTFEGAIRPSQLIFEVAGARTVYEKLAEGGGAAQRVQVLAGARYNMFNTNLEVNSLDIDEDVNQNWIDPFVGARMYQAISPLWGMNLRADVGGFGIGSEFTFNGVATFGYNIGIKRSILLGWRYYYQNYSNDDFAWDVTESGPFLGFQTRF